MSQLAQEKQVNLRTSARLNALSQYVPKTSFSEDIFESSISNVAASQKGGSN